MTYNEPETRQKFFSLEEIRVVDGDTIHARIPLAFGQALSARIRLKDWYAAELEGPAAAQGRAAKSLLESWIAQRKVFLFCGSQQNDLHGRILAHLWWNGRIITGEEVLGEMQLTKERHSAIKSALKKSETGPRVRPFRDITNEELRALMATMDDWDNPTKWDAQREWEERVGSGVIVLSGLPPTPPEAESVPSSLS